MYLKNAYRVLLTRARQGMVIVVPEGDPSDPTRDSAFYDPVWEYLKELGLQVLANQKCYACDAEHGPEAHATSGAPQCRGF